MSTAAFSTAANHPTGISFARHGRPTGTPSSAAADEALRRIIDGRRLRSRSGGVAHPRRSAFADRVSDLAGSTDAGVLIRQACKAIVLATVAIVLASATIRIVMGGRSLAGIEGTVRLGDAPLAHGVLEFHLRSTADPKDSFQTMVHTDASGAFRRSRAAGLPPGRYAVVVKARNTAASTKKRTAIAIPGRYSAAASTPLSVEVTGSSAAFELVVQP